MEASTQLNDFNKISNSTGIVDDYIEKGLWKAEKRLKKLERDYQHTYKNYKETQSNQYRLYIEAKHTKYRSCQAGYCIGYYKNLREELQNHLDKLNKVEATQRGIQRPNPCKKVSILHGFKSLAQEKRILQQQIRERQQHNENNDLGQETIHSQKISWEWELNYSQSRIPKSSNSKAVHDLLRKFKETKKLRDKAIIANGEFVNNPTSQDNLTTSIEMEIKLLTKVIKKLAKERGTETRTDNGHEEKIRHLAKKCELICRKWDEQKKYILGLKNIHT